MSGRWKAINGRETLEKGVDREAPDPSRTSCERQARTTERQTHWTHSLRQQPLERRFREKGGGGIELVNSNDGSAHLNRTKVLTRGQTVIMISTANRGGALFSKTVHLDR